MQWYQEVRVWELMKLGKFLRVEPHVRISVPVKRESRTCALCQVKTQQKDGNLQTRKKALTKHQICQHHDPGLINLQNCEE